uniref:Uncharacterized protein n=1 Tax=Romanomermis culicivorax TaxID=13658 RepID=A0A915K598_ROMCU
MSNNMPMLSPKPLASSTQQKPKSELQSGPFSSAKPTPKRSRQGPHSHSIAVLTVATDHYRDSTLSTDCHSQNSAPPPNKFVSFQPQPLEEPPQPQPPTEMLLEQLIQCYDRNHEE